MAASFAPTGMCMFLGNMSVHLDRFNAPSQIGMATNSQASASNRSALMLYKRAQTPTVHEKSHNSQRINPEEGMVRGQLLVSFT